MDFSLVVVCGLFVVVASLIAEHVLQDMRASAVIAHWLSSCGSWAQEHRSIVVAQELSCGIVLDQGLKLCLLHRQVDSSSLSHRGSPHMHFVFEGSIKRRSSKAVISSIP